MKKLCAALLALALLLCLGACRADISAYASTPITVTGLTGEPFTVTPGELAQMECVRATARGNSDKAGTVRAYGPTLESLAQAYGRTLSEFRYVRFSASDNYDVTINALIWDSYEVILSVANGSKPLEERQQPLRVVIPGYDSGKWVRLVTQIQFVPAETGGAA